MLKKIKSNFFIKILFSHLNRGNILKIAKYNKILQNILDINLNKYKLFSGRYIIYDTNGKVKEYYNDNQELAFEGEYLNGKRNGKGKEYRDGKLLFEGEYVNGERNGKGKEYNKDKLIFEGEFLNNKKWNGTGKEYNEDNKLKYEVEYEKNGKGKKYYPNCQIFFLVNIKMDKKMVK